MKKKLSKKRKREFAQYAHDVGIYSWKAYYLLFKEHFHPSEKQNVVPFDVAIEACKLEALEALKSCYYGKDLKDKDIRKFYKSVKKHMKKHYKS